MPTFTKGQQIKCIQDVDSNGSLKKGDVYTVARLRGDRVVLKGIPDAVWRESRFEAVAEPVTTPVVTIDPEGIRVTGGVEEIRFDISKPQPPKVKPGDWVAVQAQVLESTADDSPGDHLVEFFSHNEQWNGWVRKDRVVPIPTPSHVEQCTAMTVNVMDTNVYYRCEKPEHRRFDKDHKSGQFEWTDGDTSAYVEEC